MFYTVDNTGLVEALPVTFDGPYGLPGITPEGARAPDSKLVSHTDDGIPTITTYTITGTVHGNSSADTLQKLANLADQVTRCVRLKRMGRYLTVSGGVPQGATMGFAMLSATLSVVFRLTYLSWRLEVDDSEVLF